MLTSTPQESCDSLTTTRTHLLSKSIKGVVALTVLLSLAAPAISAPTVAEGTPRTLEGHAAKTAKLSIKYHGNYEKLPLSSSLHEKEKEHLHALSWKAANSTGATMVCLHALGLCPEAFLDFGSRMSELGVNVTAVEVRGFGATRNRPGYQEMDPEATVVDLTKLLRGLREKQPNEKIFLVGESMGGALAIRVAREHPELVDGIVCSAPAWQLHQIKRITTKGIFDLFLGFGEHRVNDLRYSARAVIGQATSNPEVSRHWREDGMTKLNLKLKEAWRYYQFMKTTPGSAEKLTDVPVLMVQGLQDRLAKPYGSAQLYKIMSSNKKQFAVVTNREHLVFEEGMLSDEVADYLQHWVQRQMAEQSRPRTATVAARSGREEIQPIVVMGGTKLSTADKKKLNELVQLSGASVKHLATTQAPIRE